MPCIPLVDNKNRNVGFVCVTPGYHTFVGKKRIDFLYNPWYGVEVLNEKGRTRRGTKKELDAICDWLRRNTYKHARNGDRERIGYVKNRWKP